MVHVIEKKQYFLFQIKAIHSKELVCGFDFPNKESFNINVNVTLVRSHSSKIQVMDGYLHFVDKATSFDFIEHGSLDMYDSTRIL